MKKLLLSKLSLSLLLIPSLSEAATAWTLTSGTVGVDTTYVFAATDTDLGLSGTMTVTTTNALLFNMVNLDADSRIRFSTYDDEPGLVTFSYTGDQLEDQSTAFWSWGANAEMTFASSTVEVIDLANVTQVFNGDGDGTKANGDPIELGPLQNSWGSFNLGNVGFSSGAGRLVVDGIQNFDKVIPGAPSQNAAAGFEIFGTLAVPEPSSTALIFGLGCLGFVARRRRI